MCTAARLLVAVALVFAGAAAAAAQPGPAPGSRAWVESLTPQWSRPVGGATRLVGVEEYGRCSVFVDQGVVQVITPSGDVSWTWKFKSISKYINPDAVAVSHACDAIAFAGNASYKYVWIVDQAGSSASVKFTATPADVEFDRNGTFVAVGTYAGSMHLYSRHGTLQWERATKASIVQGLAFADDNQHIRFKDWSGGGVVSIAGHVEWSQPGTLPDDETSMSTAMMPHDGSGWRIAESDDRSRRWLLGAESIDCVDDRGAMLATITVAPGVRVVKVSRDFAQVLIVTEKDLHPVSVERYAIPAPCKP